jgi:hypothetical protein
MEDRAAWLDSATGQVSRARGHARRRDRCISHRGREQGGDAGMRPLDQQPHGAGEETERADDRGEVALVGLDLTQTPAQRLRRHAEITRDVRDAVDHDPSAAIEQLRRTRVDGASMGPRLPPGQIIPGFEVSVEPRIAQLTRIG